MDNAIFSPTLAAQPAQSLSHPLVPTSPAPLSPISSAEAPPPSLPGGAASIRGMGETFAILSLLGNSGFSITLTKPPGWGRDRIPSDLQPIGAGDIHPAFFAGVPDDTQAHPPHAQHLISTATSAYHLEAADGRSRPTGWNAQAIASAEGPRVVLRTGETVRWPTAAEMATFATDRLAAGSTLSTTTPSETAAPSDLPAAIVAPQSTLSHLIIRVSASAADGAWKANEAAGSADVEHGDANAHDDGGTEEPYSSSDVEVAVRP